MRLRREVVQSPKSVKSSLAAQAVLRRVENERDDALANVHSVTVERDTLHERLKVSQSLDLLSFYSLLSDQSVSMAIMHSDQVSVYTDSHGDLKLICKGMSQNL